MCKRNYSYGKVSHALKGVGLEKQKLTKRGSKWQHRSLLCKIQGWVRNIRLVTYMVFDTSKTTYFTSWVFNDMYNVFYMPKT